ncbi:hypothetical protein BDW71DRAFT_33149 [Aspergillus fruticulosus]
MLSTVPREILLLIAGHLPSPKDTLSLASCCHIFHALLTPYAFTTLDLDNLKPSHLSCLTHVLARNPRLAHAVRVLRLGDVGYSPPSEILYEPDTMRPLLEAALATSSSTSRKVQAWETALKSEYSNADSWMAVLLPLLPNLEELATVFHWPSTYTRRMIQRVTSHRGDAGAAQPLSRLREVTFRWWDTEGGLPSSWILQFFRLGSLRIFRGIMLRDGDRYDEDMLEEYLDDYEPIEGEEEEEEEEEEQPDAKAAEPLPREHFSNVTHLHLHCSNSERGFPDLISAPRRLESFEYEHSGQNGRLDPFNPRGFYKSLYKHKDSLAEITVCEDTWSYSVESNDDAAPEKQFIGSFSDFGVLRKLRLPGQNVLDWMLPNPDAGMRVGAGARNTLDEILPVSLECLTIEAFQECDSVSLTGYLEDFVGGGYCPKLRVLEIKGCVRSLEESLANLAEMCWRRGIMFRFWDPVEEHFIGREAMRKAHQEKLELEQELRELVGETA